MVRLRNIQGKICRFKQESECADLGLATDEIPSMVRIQEVLILDRAPSRRDYVKVMTITSTRRDDEEYLPISPVPKKEFPMQVRLRNNLEVRHRKAYAVCPSLRQLSYLRIDESYEVPLEMLDVAEDKLGGPLRVCLRKTGGMGQLGDFLKKRERKRYEELREDKREAGSGVEGGNNQLARMMEQFTLEP